MDPKSLLDKKPTQPTRCRRICVAVGGLIAVAILVTALILVRNHTMTCPDGYGTQTFIKTYVGFMANSFAITHNDTTIFRVNCVVPTDCTTVDTILSKNVASMECNSITCATLPYQKSTLTVEGKSGTIGEIFSPVKTVDVRFPDTTYRAELTGLISQFYIYKNDDKIAVVKDVVGGCGLLPCRTVCFKDGTSYFDSIVTYMFPTFMYRMPKNKEK
jgi:hypothetical protein